MERLSAGAQCHCSLVEAQWHTRSGKATSLGDDFDSCFGVYAKLLRRNMQCLFFACSEVSRGVFFILAVDTRGFGERPKSLNVASDGR